MRLKTANTPDGFVVREITATGESAWRSARDGTVQRCPDHKGPWLAVEPTAVPPRIWAALREAPHFKLRHD